MKWTNIIVLPVLISIGCQDPGLTNDTKTISEASKTLLAIFAHSDDEFTIAPLLSKYARTGTDVHLITAADGSKGVTAHYGMPAGKELAIVRAEELRCTARTLGINPPILLNFEDGMLVSRALLPDLANQLDSLIRKIKPHTVITFGPDGGYGHPDHRMVSNITTQLFQKNYKEYQSQLLYVGIPNNIFDNAPEISTPQANWFKDNFHTTHIDQLKYRIEYQEEDLDRAREGLYCCASQFTRAIMDELVELQKLSKGISYLRSWEGEVQVKHDVFQ